MFWVALGQREVIICLIIILHKIETSKYVSKIQVFDCQETKTEKQLNFVLSPVQVQGEHWGDLWSWASCACFNNNQQ